jgi:hypothetical protein
VIFGSQRDPNWPQFSHTFATFMKTAANGDPPADQSLDTHTISWLPKRLEIGVLRQVSEPGINLDLQSTLRWATSLKARIFQWGPFEIRQELYERALCQIARLQSGSIGYKAIDWYLRPRTASNCIHAVSDLDMDRGKLRTGVKRGEQASVLVTRHLLPWMISPATTHDRLSERLGLQNYPIIQRKFDSESLGERVHAHQRLLVAMQRLIRTSGFYVGSLLLLLRDKLRRQEAFDNAKPQASLPGLSCLEVTIK